MSQLCAGSVVDDDVCGGSGVSLLHVLLDVVHV